MDLLLPVLALAAYFAWIILLFHIWGHIKGTASWVSLWSIAGVAAIGTEMVSAYERKTHRPMAPWAWFLGVLQGISVGFLTRLQGHPYSLAFVLGVATALVTGTSGWFAWAWWSKRGRASRTTL